MSWPGLFGTLTFSSLFFVDKELPIKQCSEISCNGRGDCLNLAEGGFTCICHEEYTGAECEYSMYSCHLTPCHNNENSTVGINGTVSCLCHPGWTGQFCSDGLLLNEFTLIIISIFIRYPWLTNSVNLIVWGFNKGFKNKFVSVPGTNNHANSNSFSITLMQLPYKLGQFEWEMLEILSHFH